MALRIGHEPEKLLRDSPRGLEVVCALMLLGVALMFLIHVAFYEWFYWTYRRDYAYTIAGRIEDWIWNVVLLALTFWMIRTGRSLLLGESSRNDRGLLAPATLRIWGIVFAVSPLLLLVVAPKLILHFEISLGFWTAAGACFVLAAKRKGPPATARSQSFEDTRPRPIE